MNFSKFSGVQPGEPGKTPRKGNPRRTIAKGRHTAKVTPRLNLNIVTSTLDKRKDEKRHRTKIKIKAKN